MKYTDSAWDRVKETPKVKKEIESKGEFLARLGGSLMLTGVQNQGYYNSKLFIEDCHRNIDILEANYGEKYRYKLYLDHAGLHKLLSPDSLNIKNLNMSIGGKKANLRDGWFYR